MTETIFNHNNHEEFKNPLFFGKDLGLARYDRPVHQWIDSLQTKQVSFFWQPSEVDCSREAKDFKSLDKAGQHIFSSNLKVQILLDSIQGRAPVKLLLHDCSNTELENFVITWSFFETIHSKSYTHIIKNVYSNPSEIFDQILNIPEIIDRAQDITKYYDNLQLLNNTPNSSVRERARALWLCLNAINALEGIRFYSSFACSWNFAEMKKMESNAKIIKLIARDENLHLSFTQKLIKTLPSEQGETGAMWASIKEETADEVLEIFSNVIKQEYAWCDYLFKYGSMIGLNADLLKSYIDWIAHKRMQAIGIWKGKLENNPLPWTQKWIAGEDVQTAPQESSIVNYLVGAVNNDLTENSFSGLKL